MHYSKKLSRAFSEPSIRIPKTLATEQSSRGCSALERSTVVRIKVRLRRVTVALPCAKRIPEISSHRPCHRLKSLPLDKAAVAAA